MRPTEPPRLADMHGRGIGYEGVTVAEVAADHDGKTYPGGYVKTQAISVEVYTATD